MSNEIKISTLLDVSSVRVAENAFRGLIKLAGDLNRATDHIAQSVSKINTGPQGQPGRPGIKTGPQAQTGVAGSIIGDPTQAERATDRILKCFDRLEQRAASLATTMRTVSAGGGASGGASGWASKAIRSIEEGAGGGPAPWSSGGTTPSGTTPSGAPVYNVPAVSGKRSAPGVPGWGKIGSTGALSGGAQGLMYGAAGGMEALASGNMGGFLGSTLGRLGLVGDAGYAGYRVGAALTDMGANTYYANQAFALENPVLIQQKLAAAMSPFRGMATAGISKDYASMLAWKRVWSNPEIMRSVTDVELNKESILRLQDQLGFTGMAKSLASTVALKLSGAGLSVSDWASEASRLSIPDAQMKSTWDIQTRVRQEQLYADMGGRLDAAKAAEDAKMNPYTALMANEIGQNFMGRFQSLASAGLTSGIIHRKGQPDMTAYEYYNAAAMERGWTPGERSSNYQALLGLGRGYSSVLGGFNLVSAGMAGFGSLGQDVKEAGMIGGNVGAAAEYLRLINKRGGLTGTGGGLDVSVSNQLFGGLAQSALGTGMYGAGNLDWVSQNMAAMIYGGGNDVAGQQRAAYGFDMGNQQMRTYTTGSRSPFNRALSNEAAMAAAGGFSGASMDLMRLAQDPRLLSSIAAGAKGAKIPRWVDSSVTRGMVQKFMARERAGLFADVMDKPLSSDPMTANLLRQVRSSGGDYTSVITSNLEGLKRGSKEWWKQEHYLAVKLGRALGNDNPQADISMLEEGYLGTLGLKPPRGSGAWRPGMSGPEREAAKKAAEGERAKGVAGAGPEVAEALGQNPAQFAAAGAKQMSDMSKMIVSFDQGVGVFSRAVERFADLVGYHAPGPPGHARGPSITPIIIPK